VSKPEAADKRDRQRVADLIGSLLLLVLGALFAAGGIGYGLQRGGRIGPGFMPLLAGSALVVFAILVGVEALRRPPSSPRSPSKTAEEKSYRFVAVVMALTSGTVLLVQLLGFLVACALLIFVLVAVVERQGWRSALLISVGATAIIWLIFVRLLVVPLPTGMLGGIVGT
jgi:putative tricarboxylic transport membrane protein